MSAYYAGNRRSKSNISESTFWGVIFTLLLATLLIFFICVDSDPEPKLEVVRKHTIMTFSDWRVDEYDRTDSYSEVFLWIGISIVLAAVSKYVFRWLVFKLQGSLDRDTKNW